MVHSEHARRYLLDEGLRAEKIIKTGSPMLEVLSEQKEKIEKSEVLNELGLEKGKYFLVSIHREENVDYKDNFKELLTSINKIAEEYNYPVIFSTHPRTRKKLETLDMEFNPLIKFMKPLGFTGLY